MILLIQNVSTEIAEILVVIHQANKLVDWGRVDSTHDLSHVRFVVTELHLLYDLVNELVGSADEALAAHVWSLVRDSIHDPAACIAVALLSLLTQSHSLHLSSNLLFLDSPTFKSSSFLSLLDELLVELTLLSPSGEGSRLTDLIVHTWARCLIVYHCIVVQSFKCFRHKHPLLETTVLTLSATTNFLVDSLKFYHIFSVF